jgi:hypothetical protein
MVSILAFALIIGALIFLGAETMWNPPRLIPALNIVFLTGISLFVSLLAARSYLAQRSLAVLLLGCGTLALALGGLAASLYLAGPGTNSMVSVYNTMACLAEPCHLASAMGSISPGVRRERAGWPPLLASYLSIIILISLLIFLVQNHIWPVHFVEGSGRTDFGMIVLWATAALFALSAFMLMISPARDGPGLRRWYGLGLAPIAVGLVRISFQKSLRDPLNWTGRLAEYLSTIYMLIAVTLSVQKSGEWLLPLGRALRESEDRYPLMFENSFDAILITTPDVGRRLCQRRCPSDVRDDRGGADQLGQERARGRDRSPPGAGAGGEGANGEVPRRAQLQAKRRHHFPW